MMETLDLPMEALALSMMADRSLLVVPRYVLIVSMYQCVEIFMIERLSPSVAVVPGDMVSLSHDHAM